MFCKHPHVDSRIGFCKLKERCILILVEVDAWNVLKSCILYFCSHEADRLGMVGVGGVEKLTLKL